MINPIYADNNNWNCQQTNGLWNCSETPLENKAEPIFIHKINSPKLEAEANNTNNQILSNQTKTPPLPPETQLNEQPTASKKITRTVFNIPTDPTGGTAFVSRDSNNKFNNNQVKLSTSCITAVVQKKRQPRVHPNLAIKNELASNQTESLETHIEADHAVSKNKNYIDFEGDVIMTRNDQLLVSDSASYNKPQDLFTAKGNVEISQPGVFFKGDKAKYYANSQQGVIDNSSYQLYSRPAQGIAKKLTFKPGYIQMSDPTFSSCPANAEDWVIKASDMKLYTEEGYAKGEHVVVYFKGIPFIYSPYLRFPLNDKRSSGFLLPEVGYSSRKGTDISAPYYWNIAPNMDATISPRILSKRGFMIGSQFRYLGKNQKAKIYAEYLNDNNFDEQRNAAEIIVRGNEISKNRGAASFQHRARLSQNWQSNIDYNYVSDNYYIDDFGNNLKDRSETHLLREASIGYKNKYLKFLGKAQGYQELRKNVNTYSRLPQLLLSAYNIFKPAGITIGAGFTSEAVQFAKNWNYDKVSNEGARYHIRPYLNMPIKRQYGYINPKLSLDALQYNLNETKTSNIETNSNRTLPIFSLDSGLFFEKELSLFNTSITNTLEPRLFYLYVPYQDQSSQAVFDSSLNQFTFSQLFRENRFSGADRLNDANQLSFALTSRFYDNNNGFERFRASIGQILYFQDRKVQLNTNTPIETQVRSAIATELASQFLPSWNTSLSMIYDPYQNKMDTSTYRLQYKNDAFHIINFDYTFKGDGTTRQNYEQLDFSTYWKILARWRGIARWNYSIRDNFNLETMLGLEYDSCCYAMRLVISREQAYLSNEPDNRFMLQMQFKGLASIGNMSDKTLRTNIPGFEQVMDK